MPLDAPLQTYSARPTVRIGGQALPLLSANIARMTAREQQGGLSSLELVLYDVLSFGDGGAGYGATAGSPLQLGVDIAIYAGATETPQAIFAGTVTAIEAEASPSNAPQFTMLAEDRLWKARRTRRQLAGAHFSGLRKAILARIYARLSFTTLP